MSNNRIIARPFRQPILDEYEAAEAVTPGMVIEVNSDEKVQKHSTAGGSLQYKVAREDEYQGKTIDEDYASGDKVSVWTPRRGERGNLILLDGENVSIGDYVESAGDGTIQKYIADTEATGTNSSGNVNSFPTSNILGFVTAALDLSDSSGAEDSGALGYNKRIIVEFI